MNSGMKNFLTKSRNGVRLFLPVEKIKTLVFILILVSIFSIVHISGFDMDINCDKGTNSCTISKINPYDDTPINISKFDTARIHDIIVNKRKLENNKTIYDILLTYGIDGNEQMFINYGFTNSISANTVMVKLAKYLESSATTLNISKHCYFNEYFCFIKNKKK